MTKDAWLVVGNGAIGLLWATKLKQLGEDVTLVYRRKRPSSPIVLENLDEANVLEEIEFDVELVSREQLEGKYTKILLCTKAFDLVSAFLDVRQHTKKNSLIATLCNGMGAQQALIPHLRKYQSLWAGVTSEGALKLSGNRVRKTGQGDTFFGLLHLTHESLYGDQFPYPNVQTHEIEIKLTEKIAINAIINPLTAIFSVTNGKVLESPIRPIFDQAIQELTSLLKHKNFPYANLMQNLTYDTLHEKIAMVATRTATNCSSMYQDVRNHRHTENQYISGYFSKLFKKETAPLQTFFYEAINNRAQLEDYKKRLLDGI